MEKLVDGLVELAVRLMALGAGLWLLQEWLERLVRA